MDILLALARQMGLQPKKVASTGGGEYHSACPKCGGDDRFFIQPNFEMKNCFGRYACRQCSIKGDTIQFCREIMGLEWGQAVAKSNARVPQLPIKPLFKKLDSKQIKPPPCKWSEKAELFVDWASKEIENKTVILNVLEQRGISRDAVKRYRIGYTKNTKSNYGEFIRAFSEFGLSEELKQNGQPKKIWIPSGIVIPIIEPSGIITRLKIRRDSYSSGDTLPKYIAISGSMQGLNLIGSRDKTIMVVVESELDAYALHNALGDFSLIVSVGSNMKTPDNFTDHLAKAKPFIFICHDNDDAGLAMLKKWKSIYSHAKALPVPIGKDIGEAVRLGLDLRSWFLSVIPKRFLDQEGVK